jgi:hypothetical protein
MRKFDDSKLFHSISIVIKNIIFNENTLYEYVLEPIEQGFQFSSTIL